jgi:6-phosphogluconolactonase
MRFWVGASTVDVGIGVLQAGEPGDTSASGRLGMLPLAVAASGSPSWLTAHPAADVVYAALEGAGTVQAYRRAGEAQLEALGDPVAAGDAVCHVAVAPRGGYLLASCWGDGRLVRVPLDADGALGRPTVAPAATDPWAGRTAGEAPGLDADAAAAARALRAVVGAEYADLVPGGDEEEPEAEEAVSEGRPSRAHSAVFLPGGWAATIDLGVDLVRFWAPAGGGLRFAQQVALPRGSGPRHAVWHPSGHLYVLTEASGEVFVIAADREGVWHARAGVPLLGGLEGDAGAEIALGRDATTVYAGLRGSDTIGVLRVRGGGEALEQLALVEAGARWPRHHLVVDDTLLVAGQRGDEIVSLPLDARTGVPGGVRHRAASPSPSCLLPVS